MVSKRASKLTDDKSRQLNILYHSNKYHLYKAVTEKTPRNSIASLINSWLWQVIHQNKKHEVK